MVAISKDSFARMLAACGASPALFDDSDGTSKREALRQFHLGTVRPLAKASRNNELDDEAWKRLPRQAGPRVFDNYPLEKAASLSGVLMDDADGD